jgi:hypothetical protein
VLLLFYKKKQELVQLQIHEIMKGIELRSVFFGIKLKQGSLFGRGIVIFLACIYQQFCGKNLSTEVSSVQFIAINSLVKSLQSRNGKLVRQ